MVAVLELVGLLVVVLVNSALAALLTRFFRVRLETRWGTVIYIVVLAPLVLLGVVLVLSGVVGLGGDLGSAGTVVALTVLLPLAIGVTFDYFWMPAPEDVDLPEPDARSRWSGRGESRQPIRSP
jgi:hypothetical protein